MKSSTKNLLLRLLLAIIVLPLLSVAVFLVPWANHIMLAAIALCASIIAVLETVNLLKMIGIKPNRALAVTEAITLPVVAFLIENEDFPFQLPSVALSMVLLFFILLNLSTEIFRSKEEDWAKALSAISANIFILIYPTYLLCYVIRIGALEHSIHAYLTFFFLTFSNDAFAYFVGILFGRKAWKPFPISPKKSVVGYLGGLFFSILFGLFSYFIKPDFFFGRPEYAVYLAILVSLVSNVGDLVESTFKRSAKVKDSGIVMLGRGGILDSIDSLLFAAPVFYYFLYLFQSFGTKI